MAKSHDVQKIKFIDNSHSLIQQHQDTHNPTNTSGDISNFKQEYQNITDRKLDKMMNEIPFTRIQNENKPTPLLDIQTSWKKNDEQTARMTLLSQLQDDNNDILKKLKEAVSTRNMVNKSNHSSVHYKERDINSSRLRMLNSPKRQTSSMFDNRDYHTTRYGKPNLPL